MYTIIDNTQELNNCFDELNIRLLQFITPLEISNSFATFNKNKLLELQNFIMSIFLKMIFACSMINLKTIVMMLAPMPMSLMLMRFQPC